MKNQIKKILTSLLPKKKSLAGVMPSPRIRAAYQGGIIDRLTASFGATSQSADREIYQTLRVLRARSRNLSQNNVYMRKFLHSLQVNVIGHEGIVLQNKAKDINGKYDEEANKTIEAHWASFCEEGVCDVTGEFSFKEICSLALESAARDGDVFIRLVSGWRRNKYRFALQLIEADLLDENYNRELPNGNKIIMGVEKNKWGKRVKYHFSTKHPGDYSYNGNRYEAIDASEILPLFVAERIGQTRGVPWAYASMILLNNIGAYTEAAILNARIGASKMGFYKTSDDGDFSKIATTANAEGEFMEEAEPGVFGKLPAGWDFQAYSPDYPHGEFPEFNKAMLRGAASGLLMAYGSISSDLSDANYSSMRSGKVDERDAYKFLQKWFVQKIPNKIFPLWLDMSLISGAITFPSGKALSYSKYDKFNAASWQTRGFDWVDPKNDIEADIVAINFGLKTRSDVAASRGKDLRDIFEQLKREKDMAEEYGLVFSSGKTEAAEKEKHTGTEKNQVGGNNKYEDN